jgi:ribosomal protein RSM22 (predicted rRNA methylase)
MSKEIALTARVAKARREQQLKHMVSTDLRSRRSTQSSLKSEEPVTTKILDPCPHVFRCPLVTPKLPNSALQQVGSYVGYSGRDAGPRVSP